jgi:hypothetical protein
MSQKFCTSCQAMRDGSTGEKRRLRNTARWVCRMCIERKTDSIYANQSGRSADVAKLMDALYRRVAA